MQLSHDKGVQCLEIKGVAAPLLPENDYSGFS